MTPGPTVGEVACRGGCGRDLDLELYPEGICPDCEAHEHRKNEEAWREP